MRRSNKKQTKEYIVNNCIDLFAELGIGKVTINQIAEKVGTSRPNIYYHFDGGKKGILTSILQIFEDCVTDNVSNHNKWDSDDAIVEQILNKLFFTFNCDDTLRYRKIIYIILSEMFNNGQMKDYVLNTMLLGKEEILADCFQKLADNKLIVPLDAGTTARTLNRVLFVYAIVNALVFPDEKPEQNQMMIHDCKNIIGSLLTQM